MSRASSSSPRSYVKRNTAYWEARHAASVASVAPVAPPPIPTPATPFPTINYGSTNVAMAADTSASSVYRDRQTNLPGTAADSFQNLKGLPLPMSSRGNDRTYAGIFDAVDLCVRAWTNIPVVRNAVEISVEFSDQPLHVKCKNKTVKKFFEEFVRVVVNRLKEQYFREYYRSGNVFLLRFDGKLEQSRSERIPIRYEILNPAHVFVPTAIAPPFTYVQFLSKFDLERLRNPLTPQDRMVYQSLPAEIRKQIDQSGSIPSGIYVPIDPNRLRYAFYKKQSYEAMAVPMVWPVLPDIEWKLMLKKYDKALAQSVEHILLLITTGEASNEWNKGNGINPGNIARLQAMFSNQALSRVLVADFSTKAQWLVPDLQGLDPKKYQQVNEDIREGLQSILTGDDKFANAQIKAKIFIQRLQQGQKKFLEEFLMPEVDRVCEDMGFRDKPTIKFAKINLQDEAIMARIIAQLGQLGILTAPQVVDTLDTSVLPDSDEMDEAQTKYKKDRDDGKYLPLVGGTQKEDGVGGAGGRPAGSGTPLSSPRSSAPIGTSASVKPEVKPALRISMKAVVDTMKAASNLETDVITALKKHFKVKGDLNDAQLGIARSLTKVIMANHEVKDWGKSVKACLAAPPMIPESVAAELAKLQDEFGLNDEYEALIARYSVVKS
jgi:hypothetical protein